VPGFHHKLEEWATLTKNEEIYKLSTKQYFMVEVPGGISISAIVCTLTLSARGLASQVPREDHSEGRKPYHLELGDASLQLLQQQPPI
jgi:hypothetical protein